jgi:ribosomal protein S18 acetylase RimI-like enzyme
VAAIDRLAFEPMWCYPEALHRSMIARLPYYVTAWLDHEMIGYLACDVLGSQGQIIRVVVTPHHQHTGIGARLMAEAIAFFHSVDIPLLALNTQSDNSVSRRLYEGFGFRRVGEEVPAMLKTLDCKDSAGESAGA